MSLRIRKGSDPQAQTLKNVPIDFESGYRVRPKVRPLYLLVALLLFLFSAFAEEPELGIIVTPLEQYNKNFLETSPSETKLRGDSLQSEGAQTIAEVANAVPNLTFAGGTARPRYFQIRGIGERELFEGIPASSIAFTIDDIDFSGIGGVASLFDIDSIEVVKGPDSFSSGPAGFAGGIHVKSADPTSFDTGKAEVILGSDDLFSGGVAVGGQVAELEALTFRASFFKSESDGFRRNVFLDRDDTNGRDATVGRLKLKAQFNDETSLTLSTFHVQNKDGYDAFTIDNDFKTDSDKPGVDEQRTNAVSLKLEKEFENIGILSNAFSFARSGMRQSFDGDWGNYEIWFPNVPYDYFYDQRRRPKILSNDLRIATSALNPQSFGDSEASVGIYLSKTKEDSDIDEYSDMISYNSVDSRYNTESSSPYGSGSIVFAPSWVGTIGLRGEFRDFNFRDSREAYFSDDEFLISGTVGIRKYLSDADYLFYNLSNSEKPGGINPGTSIPEERKQFGNESLLINELGAFFAWKDNSAVKLAAFYGRRNDQQVKTSFQSDPNDPLTFAYFTDNAAKGELYGVEVETIAKIFDRLTLRLSGAILRTEVNDLVLIDRAVDGRDQAYAPRYSFDSSLEYDFGRGWYAGVGLGGKDKFFYDDSHDQRSDPYSLLNAHVGFQTTNWKIELWGRNIGNERYGTRGFFFGVEPPYFEAKEYVHFGDPRIIGITGSYSW